MGVKKGNPTKVLEEYKSYYIKEVRKLGKEKRVETSWIGIFRGKKQIGEEKFKTREQAREHIDKL